MPSSSFEIRTTSSVSSTPDSLRESRLSTATRSGRLRQHDGASASVARPRGTTAALALHRVEPEVGGGKHRVVVGSVLRPVRDPVGGLSRGRPPRRSPRTRAPPPSRPHRSSSAPASSSANSSPPMRKATSDPRVDCSRASATRRRTSSPAEWPLGVVDELEPVEVDQHEAEASAVAAAALDLPSRGARAARGG